jgi:deoxyadenosine/deoxycytidine kinase
MQNAFLPIAAASIPRPKPSARLFIVEGEIAAGKSILVDALDEELARRGWRVAKVPEPVDLWRRVGILSQFYADPARYAYTFQTFAYATRILAIAKAVAECPNADILLFERSPATDGIFMAIQGDSITPLEMELYRTWCDSYNMVLPVDLSRATVLYLKPGLDHCMARLKKRDREGEVRPSTDTVTAPADAKVEDAKGGVSVAYQTKLRRAHEAFFLGLAREEFPLLPKSPFRSESVVEVPEALANGDFLSPGPERDRIISEVIGLMKLK